MGCRCVVSMEVLMGPEAGKATSAVELGPTQQLAIGRSKKFVHGKGQAGGLLLTTDLDVSSRHAHVVVDPATNVVCIRDCKSTNGTKLNDTPLPPDVLRPLAHGDTIMAGSSLIVFRVHQRCLYCDSGKSVVVPPSTVAIASSSVIVPVHEPANQSMQDGVVSPALNVALPSTNVTPHDVEFESDFVAPPPPPRPPKVVEPTHNCIVCHASLWGLDSTARQAHVNDCLDGAPISKKNRRHMTADKHQMELAVALSRSVVAEDVECAVSRGMLEREIADVDASIAKLQKKRLGLMRKLHRNSKQTRRVAPSSILPPQVVAQWDVPAVLADLFPPSRRVLGSRTISHQTHGDDGGGVSDHGLASSRANPSCDTVFHCGKHIMRHCCRPLWHYAAQEPQRGPGLVVPSLAPFFAQLNHAAESAPFEVQMTFPAWKENLTFLASCSVASVEAAHARLRAEMTKLKEAAATDDPNAANMAVVYKALEYFDQHMQSTILHKTRQNDVGGGAATVMTTGDDAVPVLR